MGTDSHCWGHLLLPTSTSSPLQPRRLLTRKRKVVGFSEIEKTGLIPPIALQASAKNPTLKWTRQTSESGGQLGIGVRPQRLPKRGKQLLSCISPKVNAKLCGLCCQLEPNRASKSFAKNRVVQISNFAKGFLVHCTLAFIFQSLPCSICFFS
jgi:hypothetical protein